MRRFTALLNPISGGRGTSSRAVWGPVHERISEAGAQVNVVETRSAAHAYQVARQAAGDCDVVIAVGGDGLLRDVANGVVGTDAALGIVPAGRGNDFARCVGIGQDPAALARLLLSADRTPVDAIQVAGTIALGNVYVGLDSRANMLINRFRRVPPLLLYRAAGPAAMLTWRAVEARVVVDDQVRELAVDSVVVANSGWYGHGVNIVPGCSLRDGLLDVMVVAAGPKRNVFAIGAEARSDGTHVHRHEIEILRGTRVEISTARPVPLCADGDEIGALPTTIEAAPGALFALLPASTEGAA